ncbi:MAG: GNAT family N-acetyltransferase [Woeseiaceae bacterium]
MRLETARLVIRSFDPSMDFGPYYSIVADANVMKYLGGVLSKEQAVQYIDRAIETERTSGYARYAVIHKERDELVGMCGFAPVRDYIDLGYRFAKCVWGRGLATEAASAVVAYGFAEHGFREIVALTHPENSASISVLEKLGFSYQHDETTPMGTPARRYVGTKASTT